LRLLEKKGFLYRNYQATIPPAVTYGLTKRTTEMQAILKDLAQLAKKWYAEDNGDSVAAQGSHSGTKERVKHSVT
jgi:DNA-binding HxlR family transcriptional regulator